jgi:hypothetical protein
VLFHRLRLEIAFAHRTFVWPGRAAVHCVIVGLARNGEEPAEKRLFSYIEGKGDPVETQHDWLTAYLFDANGADRHLVVKETPRPLSSRPSLVFGNMPNDDGNLVLSPAERALVLRETPALEPFVRRLLGAKDSIQGGERFCLWLNDADPRVIRSSVFVSERLKQNRVYRAASPRSRTKEFADYPGLFGKFDTLANHSCLCRGTRRSGGNICRSIFTKAWKLRTTVAYSCLARRSLISRCLRARCT